MTGHEGASTPSYSVFPMRAQESSSCSFVWQRGSREFTGFDGRLQEAVPANLITQFEAAVSHRQMARRGRNVEAKSNALLKQQS